MTEKNDLYIQKIADITRVPYSYVLALRDFGLFDDKSVRDNMIRYDFWTLTKLNKFTNNQIYEKLAWIYNVNKNTVRTAVKNKPRKSHYCRLCGHKVNRTLYITNKGLCDKCYADQNT